MQSSGGVMSAAETAQRAPDDPVGPGHGVIAASRLAALGATRDRIAFDMGGTSTDICLIHDGRPRSTAETSIDGRPIKVPQIDIHTIGSGGGSIAASTRPVCCRTQSAGARPSPALLWLRRPRGDRDRYSIWSSLAASLTTSSGAETSISTRRAT
ncbi:MAG: hydantoinase/oxoprolinase family protein [Solirubrobacteraceae bacterium]